MASLVRAVGALTLLRMQPDLVRQVRTLLLLGGITCPHLMRQM